MWSKAIRSGLMHTVAISRKYIGVFARMRASTP